MSYRYAAIQYLSELIAHYVPSQSVPVLVYRCRDKTVPVTTTRASVPYDDTPPEQEFDYQKEKERKGKERKSIYIAPLYSVLVSKRSDMDHTVLPANYAMPAFPS